MKTSQRRARASRLLSICFVTAMLASLYAAPASAQFRNNGLQVPNVGWLGLGTSMDWFNDSVTGGPRWGATDQVTLGVGYFRAVGYNLWVDSQTVLGFGGAVNQGAFAKTLVSLAASIGLRYNFLDEKHRPFVAAHIQYLNFFNHEGTDVLGNAALGGFPVWVGIRPEAGYEFFFLEEMSIQAQAGPIVFFNLDHPPKVSALARIAYNVYF
jgi:hypothetical protein